MMASPAARLSHRSPVKTAAFLYGAVLLLVGVAGFVPGLTTGYDSLQFAGHSSGATLLGLFQVSVLHNVLHMFSGTAGLVVARSTGGARTYLRWGGAGYLVLWLHGLLVGRQSPVNFLPLNSADDWLHLLFGVTMVGLSFLGRGPARGGAADPGPPRGAVPRPGA